MWELETIIRAHALLAMLHGPKPIEHEFNLGFSHH